MDKLVIATTAIVLVITLTVSGVVLTTFDEQIEKSEEAREDRAKAVYGEYQYDSGYAGSGTLFKIPMPEDPEEYNDTELVRKHMYVTGFTYEPWELADDLNLSRQTVKTSLAELEQRGIVDSGYQANFGFIPNMQWVHSEHGELPDEWWSPYASVLPVLGILTGIVVLIGCIQRYRGNTND